MSLFATLKPKPKSTSATCLLLDVSGSMDEKLYNLNNEGIEPRRIEVLFKAVRETPECQNLKAFTFSTHCNPIEVIPSEAESYNYATQSSTNLSEAFRTIKSAGFFNAILVTDGEPDNPKTAIQEAYGMKLGIIYIGNPPIPNFLQHLAQETNGTFALADMASSLRISEAIIHALPPPETITPKTDEVIKL